MKSGLNEMRRELRARVEKWKVEREELEKRIGELERKSAKIGEEWREKIKKVEKKMEVKEREREGRT